VLTEGVWWQLAGNPVVERSFVRVAAILASSNTLRKIDGQLTTADEKQDADALPAMVPAVPGVVFVAPVWGLQRESRGLFVAQDALVCCGAGG
jgi:hypothetical protein